MKEEEEQAQQPPALTCRHCGALHDGKSIVCANCGRDTRSEAEKPPAAGSAQIVRMLVWIAVLVSAGLVLLFGYTGSGLASGAPQQAAGAAMDCFHVVSIYVIGRAIDKLTH